MGEEPVWSDITLGRAAHRATDAELTNHVLTNIRASAQTHRATIIGVTGTAGSGKTTTLMQAASALIGHDKSVGWIDAGFDLSAPRIARAARLGGFEVLVIDDIDRYGRRAVPTIEELTQVQGLRAIVLAVRASRADVIDQLSSSPALIVLEYLMPAMSDDDIAAILDVLERFHRLGRLKALSDAERRQEFKARADRQLLVALIEATSGRKFDEKVLSEWEDLTAEQRTCYTISALAYSLRETLSREEMLLALSSLPREGAYHALQRLIDRRLLVEVAQGANLRPRHRVVADKLVSQLAGQPNILAEAVEQLAYAMASRIPPGSIAHSRSWRLLTRLTNHAFLFRRIGLDAARRVYASIEDFMHWDYHFWLQRGELEVEEGHLRFAEQFLIPAYTLKADDPFVVTAFAHMLMRKAVCEPFAPDSETWLRQGVDYLRGQIATRGKHDEYPSTCLVLNRSHG